MLGILEQGRLSENLTKNSKKQKFIVGTPAYLTPEVIGYVSVIVFKCYTILLIFEEIFLLIIAMFRTFKSNYTS